MEMCVETRPLSELTEVVRAPSPPQRWRSVAARRGLHQHRTEPPSLSLEAAAQPFLCINGAVLSQHINFSAESALCFIAESADRGRAETTGLFALQLWVLG